MVLLAALVVAFCCWLWGWESNGWQNVILLSAATVAVLAMRVARKSERQKMALFFLREYHASDAVRVGAEIMNQWGENPPDPAKLPSDEKMAAKRFLNQLELLAIGIRNGIYDEKIIRDAMETSIVRYYQRGEGFIKDIRRKDGDVREVAYEHFQRLAEQISDRIRSAK